ncbi:unnamed protein product, partial [Closterium sp. NIES-65]
MGWVRSAPHSPIDIPMAFSLSAKTSLPLNILPMTSPCPPRARTPALLPPCLLVPPAIRFDLRISEFAARKFQRDGITVHTHARVTAVTPRALHVRETSSSRESGSSDGSKSGVHGRSSAESSSGGKSSGEREVPYGVVVWATGITAHPLVVKLREQLGQHHKRALEVDEWMAHHKRALEVDEWMAVRGAEAGSMWALGDCAAIHHRPFTTVLPFTTAPSRLCCHSPPPLHDCAAIHHRPFTTVLPFTTAPSRLCCHSPPPLHDCAAIHHRPFTTVLPFTTAPSRLCCHSPPPLHDCAAIHHRPFTTVLPFTTAPSLSSLSLVSDSYCRPFPCTLSSPLSPPSPLSPRSPPPPPPFSPLPHPPLHVPSRRASVFPPLSPTATPRPTPRMIIVRAGRGSSHIPYSRLLPCPSMPRPVSHVTTLLLSLCGQDDTARIFRAFDTNGDGCLSPSETKAALRALQQRYPHAAALLRSRDRMAQLVQVHPCPFSCCHPVSESKTTPGALAGCIARGQQGRSTARHRGAPPGTGELGNEGGEQQACEGRELSLEQFEAVLRRVEGQMKTLPATAQVAAQQGQYVARCFNRLLDPGLTPEGPLKLRGEGRHLLQPFRYVHLGQFAPLGSETMAAELPGDWVSIGRSTQWLWYSVYA